MSFFRRVLWLLGGLLAGALSLAAVNLTGGPEVTVSPTNAMVRWTTEPAAGSRVQFGVTPGRLDQRANGAVGTAHSVELKGLLPGTTYHFTAGTARVALATNQFTTRSLDPGNQVAIPETSNSPAVSVPPKAGPATAARPPPAKVTWGSPRSLSDHFDRHGADFNARSPDDYAAQAWLFLVRAQRDGLPAKRDETGVVRVFDPKTGAFAAYNRDGTTKTYFKPGRRDYFEDQLGQSVDLRQLKEFQPPQ